ncbi:MAG: glycoside hydrolase domain-containing protein [Gemmatimonadota bacterium]
MKGEAFTLQLALVSGAGPLNDVRVSFDGWPASWIDGLTCFNCGGIEEKGEAFTKRIDVPAETVQPVWIGIRVPGDQPAGAVEGTVSVHTGNRGSRSTRVRLDVQAARAINSGFDEPELQTRLFWLNSTAGRDPDFVIEPFEPVAAEGRSLSILGRRVELSESGLPSEILSYFTPELTGFAEHPEPILARPIALEVVTSGGQSAAGGSEVFDYEPFAVQQESRSRAHWRVEGRSEDFRMTVNGVLEYDGMLDYRISLVALHDAEAEEIALPIFLEPGASEYMLGLGYKGGRRPELVDWTWNVENHQEGAWLGGVNRGLQYVLRDDGYVRPLNTNFYRNQPLLMPGSWFNEGRGGIRITQEPGGGPVTALNYSGPRTFAAGDSLQFNIRFLVTPFKPIDTATHFNTRFVHQYVPVDSVKAWGGTVVNIHHANEINPYINYPFFNLDQQAAYIEEAHAKGIKVKLYNTIRELTYRANELFALRSLGDEILNDGEGGGHSWMQEHLESGYHSAWHAWRVDDAAMLNKGTSRWTNYYIEGLAWLAANQQIDGLYLDDIAFSRETVKRLVTVLHEHRDEVVIDLHSANQFNVRDGFINSAMLYMEHFPFISRLWFGEYFEYDLGPDYWMTEVSGLPFGLMGEMLQDGGHPYRGLVYGMTARKYGDVDPRPVWAMMSEFGIAESRMLGYWLDDAPVRSDRPGVLATTYAREDGVLIALGSWAESDEVVDLSVDLEALGLGPDIRAFAPAVEGLQAEAEVDLSAVRVPAGQGLFLVVTPASER